MTDSLEKVTLYNTQGNQKVNYKEYPAAPALTPYVKCYYTVDSDGQPAIEDTAFATGCIEIMFTLHGDSWLTKPGDQFVRTAPVELWGQILKPLSFRSSVNSRIFGIRLHSSAAAVFLHPEIHRFNDSVLDMAGVLGNSIEGLHSRLQATGSPEEMAALADAWLLERLHAGVKALPRIGLVRKVMEEITAKDFFDNIDNVAFRYGMSSRYLQKIFLQYTGLTPKLFIKINRFQNSLVMIGKGTRSLTEVAYACGYFDQSHFIREFRSFTGFAPSLLAPDSTTAILASANK